jgi:hypothetical protein
MATTGGRNGRRTEGSELGHTRNDYAEGGTVGRAELLSVSQRKRNDDWVFFFQRRKVSCGEEKVPRRQGAKIPRLSAGGPLMQPTPFVSYSPQFVPIIPAFPTQKLVCFFIDLTFNRAIQFGNLLPIGEERGTID